MKKVALHNLGCKVNAYETEAMQEMLENHGYEIVPFKEGADIYIINTCTVTNMADRKSRQMLHRAKKLNPDAIVVATGCYVQAQEENGNIDECIDIIIGNNKKKDLIDILEKHADWAEEFLPKYEDINADNVMDILHAEIGKVFSEVLEDAGVYKRTEEGQKAFMKFVNSLK